MNSEIQPLPPNAENKRVWDALLVLHRECAAYGLIPQVLQPYINNDEQCAKVENAGKMDELVRLVKLLHKDVHEFNGRLSAIVAKHQHRTGVATSPDDLMFALSIQEEYTDWGTSYEAVVMPTISSIVDIYAGVGVNAQPLQISSPLSVIEPQADIDAEQNSRNA